MDLINIILVSGAAGVFIAIVAMLAFLSGIGILIRKVNKRSWAYYILLFVMFTGVMLLFDQMIGMFDLRDSVISSLVSGALLTFFFFLSDKKGTNENDPQ